MIFSQFLFTVLLLCFFSCTLLPVVSSTKLCRFKNYWYDDQLAICKPCRLCKRSFLQIKKCTEFSDTMCVDPSSFTFLKRTNKEQKKTPHESDNPTEMYIHPKLSIPPNGIDPRPYEKIHDSKQQAHVAPEGQKPRGTSGYQIWNLFITASLLLVFISVLMFAIAMFFGKVERICKRNKARNGIRNRLFSRDRLSTTEYMNNLATLDRRLAMDEILEKKRRAIFEPQLLAENVYSDEVFVTLPNCHRHHDYEELRFGSQEPTQSLLPMQQTRQ